MDKQPVGQLPDLQQSNNDDEIMVITNSEYNQLKKEKISDLITDFTSTNENNALTKGTDGKMFVTDFGNASNITEGTLPVSVLPDIPKDLLPAIETTDLPASGVAANTYTYPSSVTVNAQGQVTAIEEGTPSGANANVDLSNITDAGKEVIKENSKLNEIELNNPFFFGMSQYFDVEPNNLSWLKSAGQWNSKAVYPDYYNWILEQVNSGVDGFKGIGYAYSTADSSLSYWITSTIPAVGQTVYGYSPIRALGKIESLITNGFVFTDTTSTQRTVTRNSVHDAPITDTNWINDYDFVLNTADETFRLPLKTKVAPSTESLPLYFYVGETVQNANLINAAEIVNNKANVSLANISEAGETNIKNLIYPDFDNYVALPTTLNLVQQADEDCYLAVMGTSGADISVSVCDADGSTIGPTSIIQANTASNVATTIISCLIPKGTYFKVGYYNAGTMAFTKYYTIRRQSNV